MRGTFAAQAAAPPYKIFAKIPIRRKICCTTYKNICTYQKKAIPLQREKVNRIYNIYRNCMDSCNNSHIINLLHSRKFADVNFTQSKLLSNIIEEYKIIINKQ